MLAAPGPRMPPPSPPRGICEFGFCSSAIFVCHSERSEESLLRHQTCHFFHAACGWKTRTDGACAEFILEPLKMLVTSCIYRKLGAGRATKNYSTAEPHNGRFPARVSG